MNTRHPTLNLPPSLSLVEIVEALAEEGLFLRWRHFPPQSNIGHRPLWDRSDEKKRKQA